MSRDVLTGNDVMPTALDHILLGCNDLDRGIDFVEQHTGVRAAIGGVHPGAGTRNALLSLGERRYLEIIAPDPKQTNADSPRLSEIKKLETPKVMEWAAHVDDIEGLAKRLRDQKIAFDGPQAGSRKRPDGRVLNWKTLAVEDNRRGLLPFFIQWGVDSVHPSVDAPGGCRLESFALADSDPASLTRTLGQLGLDVPVVRADNPGLQVRIVGPKGAL